MLNIVISNNENCLYKDVYIILLSYIFDNGFLIVRKIL